MVLFVQEGGKNWSGLSRENEKMPFPLVLGSTNILLFQKQLQTSH